MIRRHPVATCLALFIISPYILAALAVFAVLFAVWLAVGLIVWATSGKWIG